KMGPLDRAVLDYMHGTMSRDDRKAREAALLAARLAGESHWPFDAAVRLLGMNMAAEAADELMVLDPHRGAMRGWFPLHYYLTIALHKNQDYELELEKAERAATEFPGMISAATMVLRALIANGKIREADSTALQIPSYPPFFGVTPAGALAEAASEAYWHDQSDLGDRLVEAAVGWSGSGTPKEGSGTVALRVHLLADSLDKARDIADDLLERRPESVSVHGYSGIVGARRHDIERVLRETEWLQNDARPYQFGRPQYWLAAIAAWSGRREEAVVHLRTALSEGMSFSWPGPLNHSDSRLRPLWNYEPFKELMKPRTRSAGPRNP
ncbi:MAG: hypothetical protein ACC642_07915, partial [Pseudomonadales bacterium]